MRGIFAALLVALGCAGHHAPPYLPYAVENAAQQRKPLVVEFYATWCVPCGVFEDVVLPDPRVQEALRDVVFVRYDIERPTGRDAYARCRGSSLPLVVGIDRHGVVRLVKRGESGDAGNFLEFLRQTRVVLGAQYR